MIIDHSKSYRGLGMRAIGHRQRRHAIVKELKNINIPPNSTYCDLGCSNGYITDQLQTQFRLRATGLDYKEDHLVIGRERYPKIEFGLVNLNEPCVDEKKFDLVTCFETLEHVGNINNAIHNILTRIAPGGHGFISVPIEHGVRGIIKYLIKTIVFGYSLSELRISKKEYRKILFSGIRISTARPAAESYGTHFGFDYRDVDEKLSHLNVDFRAFNRGMTRLYLIRR